MYYYSDTPYRRFPEIREAVRKGEVRLSYNRATALRVATGKRKSFALLYLYIPAITAVVLYILTMYLPIPKTVILFALAGLLFYPFVPYISRIMVIAGVILIFLPIWFLRDSMWILAIGAGLIVIRFTYDLWWLFITRTADRALLENEDVFETEWKQKNVALQGEDGGSYYMFGKTRPEKQKARKEEKAKAEEADGGEEPKQKPNKSKK